MNAGIQIGAAGTTSVSNANLIEATGEGELTIGQAGSTTTVDNSPGGTLLATGAGSAINLFSATIIGGSVTASNGGAINVQDGAVTSTAAPMASL